MNTFDMTVELFDLEWEVELTISDYDPGVISGLPENCYPPEGGELEGIKLINIMYDQGYKDFPQEIQKILWELHKDEVVEEVGYHQQHIF
jgi:hypothetical protein